MLMTSSADRTWAFPDRRSRNPTPYPETKASGVEAPFCVFAKAEATDASAEFPGESSGSSAIGVARRDLPRRCPDTVGEDTTIENVAEAVVILPERMRS
jgi:hypothetical protein